jgi:hypothetical protein
VETSPGKKDASRVARFVAEARAGLAALATRPTSTSQQS